MGAGKIRSQPVFDDQSKEKIHENGDREAYHLFNARFTGQP
jgi:hypothetical protein